MAGPDLVIDDVEIEGDDVGPSETYGPAFRAGDTISLTWDVDNIGTSSAAASEVGIYFVGSSSEEVDNNATSTISAGGSDTNESDSFTLDSNLAPGTYAILLFADQHGDVAEQSESNNGYSFFITVEAAEKPDLTIDNVLVNGASVAASSTVGTVFHPADTISLGWDVDNDGGAASESEVGIYLISGSGSTLVDTNTTSSISSGGSDTNESDSFTLDSNLASGTYAVLIGADHEGEVDETTETNNGYSFFINVAEQPSDNASPAVTILAGSNYAAGTVLTGTELFSATDPQGSSDIDYIKVFDANETGGAVWRYNGSIIHPGDGSQGFQFEYGNRSLLTYTVGPGSNDFVIEAFDDAGEDSSDALHSISGTGTSANDPPTVTIQAGSSYAAGTVLTGTQLFSASDPQGTSDIDYIKLFDANETGGAVWRYNGSIIHPGDGSQGFKFEYGNRSLLTYTIGTGSNDFVIEAFDGVGASDEAGHTIAGRNTSTSYSISPSGASVTEGGRATFTISRSYSAAAETVYFSTIHGAASGYASNTGNSDYIGQANVSLIFPKGRDALQVTVQTKEDTLSEGDETFGAIIESEGGTTLDSSTFTIDDNDAVPVDDYASNSGTTGSVLVGRATWGMIETEGDTDWFAVRLQAHHTYQFDMEGKQTKQGTLADSYLTIRGPGTGTVKLAEADDGGEGFNSRLSLTAESTDTYFVSAGAYGDKTGSYRVGVSDTRTASQEYPRTSDVIADGKILLLAQLAKAAYSDTFSDDLGIAEVDLDSAIGGVFEKPVSHPLGVFPGSAAAHVGRTSDTMFVAFRGTDEWSDRYDWAFRDEHYNQFSVLISQIAEYVASSQSTDDPIRKLMVTGHSLGAAMAQEFVRAEANRFDVPVEAVTFASPGMRLGGLDRTDDRITNIYVAGDVIGAAALPSVIWGDQYEFYDLGLDDLSPVTKHNPDLYVELARFISRYDLVPEEQYLWNGEQDDVPTFVRMSLDSTGSFHVDPYEGPLLSDIPKSMFVVVTGGNTIVADARSATVNFAVDKLIPVEVNLLEGIASSVSWAADNILSGITSVLTGDGDDLIVGDENPNWLLGGAGDDEVHGDAGSDTLIGGSGEGDDYYDGGIGIDTVIYSSAVRRVTVDLATRRAWGLDIGADMLVSVESAIGGAASDRMFGDASDNFFRGAGGKDKIDGGAGRDTADYSDKSLAVEVTLDRDTKARVLVGGAKEDKIVNVEGVIGGSAGDILTGDSKANIFVGGGARDKLFGMRGKDTLDGGKGKDWLEGASSKDVLTGGSGKDTLDGGSGKDHLSGGKGNDSLIGGSKADTFVFDTRLGRKHADTITDFKHDKDIIALDDAVFAAVGAKLNRSEFYARDGAHKAHDATDRIIYNTSNGKLFYNADGKGGDGAVLFATLANQATLDHHDFIIV